MLTTKKTALAALMASMLVSACGGSSGGNNNDNNNGDNGGDSNAAPTDITLSSTTVAENNAGAEIGTLSATDSDDSSHSFSVNDDRFNVTDGMLTLASDVELNFEAESTVTVNVTATDSADNSYSKDITIEVEDVLDTYSFESGFTDESSVAYSGQVARYVLSTDLKDLMDTVFADEAALIEAGIANKQAAHDLLTKYFDDLGTEYESAWGTTDIRISTDPSLKEQSLIGISEKNKDLERKIAGRDGEVGSSTVTQHKDWNNGDFVGWGAEGTTTPEQLVRDWMDDLAELADRTRQGEVRNDPFGAQINQAYITEDGHNLSQLIHKFLVMAVHYSQAMDDYLDGDTEGKGLLASQDQDGDSAYSALEHQFDEGFGYFGAARNFLDYSDDEIADVVYMDTDGNGAIDLESEYNFTFAGYAAKRDRSSDDSAKTDFTQSIFDAFLQGRKIINDNTGPSEELNADELEDLKAQRDIIVSEWEKVVAANVIHYANGTIEEYSNMGTEDFDFANLATQWSEMKAFALGLQFSRFSPFFDNAETEAAFAQLHADMGDKPVLGNEAEMQAYVDKIVEVRNLIGSTYGFAEVNVENW